MAEFTTSVRTILQKRWELATPTNGAELTKAVSAAANEFYTANGRLIQHDDDLRISVEGDDVVIWFEVVEK